MSARAHLQARSQSCKQKQCDPKLAKQTNTNKTNRETLKYNLRHTGDTGATSATRERKGERIVKWLKQLLTNAVPQRERER